MFFRYEIFQKNSDSEISLCDAAISIKGIHNGFISEYINKVCKKQKKGLRCKELNAELGIPNELKQRIENISGKEYVFNPEAYCIQIGEITNIYAESLNGIIHAVTALKHLSEQNNMKEAFIYDKPYIERRGAHFFIPGRKHVNEFKKMIDNLMVNYKYNTIIFEVGGAMEYKRHPRINREWEKYCSMLLQNSGTADRIQHYTYPWPKNAIHPENGGGSYLSQEEMRDLIAYCEERGIEVIPEIPSLSHADYIVRAYPELNERASDNDPDTYCPSNPKSYEIMFDIIDEVFEVFGNPHYASIGHDEVVTICICDKCRQVDATELFIRDIKMLNDYMEKKGTVTLMYGDKFCPLRNADGSPYIDEKGKLCGGLQGYDENDTRYVPELYKAYEKLPENITILDWYWIHRFDHVFSERNVWLANVKGYEFEGWQKRIKENIKGVFASNWGRSDNINMLRNGVIQSLIFNSYMCWNKDYDDLKDRGELIDKMLKELNNYYLNNLLEYSPEKEYITVIHTTDCFIEYRSFLDGDFINEEDYHIGDYKIKYKDGTVYREKIIYGKNISNMKLDIKFFSQSLGEVSCMTVPCKYGDKTYYKWIFENPFADKEIESISFEAVEGFKEKISAFVTEKYYTGTVAEITGENL